VTRHGEVSGKQRDSQLGDAMQRIGRSLSGIGKLKSGTTEFGAINYCMNAWKETSGWKTITGSLHGNDRTVYAAFAANDTTL